MIVSLTQESVRRIVLFPKGWRMPKEKIKKLVHEIKSKLPQWNWVHSLLDWLVDAAMSLLVWFCISACSSAFAILSKMNFSFGTIVLFLVGVVGMIVSGIPLLKSVFKKGVAPSGRGSIRMEGESRRSRAALRC